MNLGKNYVEITFKKGEKLLDIFWRSGMFKSKSEIRRLFKQGAIRKWKMK